MADHRDMLQPEMVQERGDLLRPFGRREGAGRRLAVRWQVDVEHLTLIGYVGQECLPYAAGAVRSVQEHERCSGALPVERKHVNACIPHD